jgi:hypothetical protein
VRWGTTSKPQRSSTTLPASSALRFTRGPVVSSWCSQAPSTTPAAARLLQPESSSRWFSSLTETEAAEAHAAGEAAMKQRAAAGQVVVTAGYRGEIRLFENFGDPMWI